MSFGDFIGWNNPYGAILGTFGNPNFLSSFLAMVSIPTFLYLLKTWFSLLLAGIVIIAALFVALFKKE